MAFFIRDLDFSVGQFDFSIGKVEVPIGKVEIEMFIFPMSTISIIMSVYGLLFLTIKIHDTYMPK